MKHFHKISATLASTEKVSVYSLLHFFSEITESDGLIDLFIFSYVLANKQNQHKKALMQKVTNCQWKQE